MKDLTVNLAETAWSFPFEGDGKRKYAVAVWQGTGNLLKEIRVVAPSALAWTLAAMCAGKGRVSDDDTETWYVEPTSANEGKVWRKDQIGTDVAGRYHFEERPDEPKEPATLRHAGQSGWCGIGKWEIVGGGAWSDREYTAFGNGRFTVPFSTREAAEEWAAERNVQLTEVEK